MDSSTSEHACIEQHTHGFSILSILKLEGENLTNESYFQLQCQGTKRKVFAMLNL